MNRYSYPSIPVDRALQSRGSRPLSLGLGPFSQLHDDETSDSFVGRARTARSRGNVESDERPLTELELEATSIPDRDDAEREYPASWKLAVITVALCMAIFLVALVSLPPFLHQPFHPTLCISMKLIESWQGYHYCRRSYSANHGSLPCFGRRWMVWKCLPTHHLRLPTCIWQMLLCILYQDRLFDSDRHLRVWILDLWHRTHIASSHSRASDCRHGLCWDFLWGSDCHCLFCPFASATSIYRTCWSHVWHCFNRWSATGRCLYRSIKLAVVLLHQFADRCRHSPYDCRLLQSTP